jgi:hypothetical protein
MRRTPIAVAAAALASMLETTPGLAGVEIRTETTFGEDTGARTRSGRMLLDRDRLRMELPAEDAAGGRGLTLIFRADLGAVYVLDEKDRSFSVIDRDSAEQMRAKLEGAKREMQAQLGKLPPAQRLAMQEMLAERGLGDATDSPPIPRVRAVATDRTAQVGAFPCREYDLFEGERKIGEACIADWATTGTTAADFDPLRAFASFEEEMAKSMAFGGRKRAGDEMTRLFDLGGVPVRMRAERDGKKISETRLLGIERRDPPGDSFSPPPGWTKRDPSAP